MADADAAAAREPTRPAESMSAEEMAITSSVFSLQLSYNDVQMALRNVKRGILPSYAQVVSSLQVVIPSHRVRVWDECIAIHVAFYEIEYELSFFSVSRSTVDGGAPTLRSSNVLKRAVLHPPIHR